MDRERPAPTTGNSKLIHGQNLHFVFLELCARPEYAEMIHQEIKDADNLDYEGINQLPILDSFIKESVRLNPLDKSKPNQCVSFIFADYLQWEFAAKP
jgi:hypothetical protein